VDIHLAARAFWAGAVSTERGEEWTKAFLGAVLETYPEFDKFETVQKIGQIFNQVAKERDRTRG
jgi:hypothetical protein